MQLVNEQIGTENMKRRVELESRRKRMLAKMKRAMWKDYAEAQRMGYDWTARRAKWEAQLKELQSLTDDRSVPAEPSHASLPNNQRFQNSHADQKLQNDELYAEAMKGLSQLADVDVTSSTDDESDPDADLDWFQVLLLLV